MRDNKIVSAILLIAISVSTSARADAFYPVGFDKGATQWVDLDSIKKVGSLIKAWILMIEPRTQNSEGKSYDYTQVEYLINCDNDQEMAKTATMYRLPTEPVGSGDLGNTWADVIPETVGQDIEKIACHPESVPAKRVSSDPETLVHAMRRGETGIETSPPK